MSLLSPPPILASPPAGSAARRCVAARALPGLVALVAVVALEACSAPPTVVRGRLAGVDSGTVYLVREADHLNFQHLLRAADSAQVRGGAFEFVRREHSSGWYALQLGTSAGAFVSGLHIAAGDSLWVRAGQRYGLPDSVRLGGSAAAELVSVLSTWMQQTPPWNDFGQWMRLPPERLLPQLLARRRAGLDLIASRAGQLSAEQRRGLEQRVRYDAAIRLQMHRLSHADYAEPAPDSAPARDYDSLAIDSLTRPDADPTPNASRHHRLLQLGLDLSRRRATPDSLRYASVPRAAFVIAATHAAPGLDQRRAYLDQLVEVDGLEFRFSAPAPVGDSLMARLVAAVDALPADDALAPLLRRTIARVNALTTGQPMPPLALPDSAGALRSLAQLRGQWVVVDFWGSWCYPCLEAIPRQAQLKRSLAPGAPVSFFYVSLEAGADQRADWLRLLGRHAGPRGPLAGTHVVADGQFGNPVVASFLITGVPTYMLVDPEGRIRLARTHSLRELEARLRAEGLLTAR